MAEALSGNLQGVGRIFMWYAPHLDRCSALIPFNLPAETEAIVEKGSG